LEVVVALVGFFLALLVVRRTWVWRVLECSPELVALLGDVVALQMPRALLFQQVIEAARGLLRVVFRRTLDSRDCIFWLALAVRTRVVVVATPLSLLLLLLPPGFCLLLLRMASYLAFALSSSSAHEVIMSLSLVMELGLQRCDGGRDRLGKGR
jgi:hypothetical protein